MRDGSRVVASDVAHGFAPAVAMIGAAQEDGMANGGFGFGTGSGSTEDFERLARQYWGAWGDALRSAAPGGGQSGTQAWQDAIDWWTRYAHGGRGGMNDALERFNVQARDWYGRMQQVAAQFAGRDSSARDVAAAWKQALGAAG